MSPVGRRSGCSAGCMESGSVRECLLPALGSLNPFINRSLWLQTWAKAHIALSKCLKKCPFDYSSAKLHGQDPCVLHTLRELRCSWLRAHPRLHTLVWGSFSLSLYCVTQFLVPSWPQEVFYLFGSPGGLNETVTHRLASCSFRLSRSCTPCKDGRSKLRRGLCTYLWDPFLGPGVQPPLRWTCHVATLNIPRKHTHSVVFVAEKCEFKLLQGPGLYPTMVPIGYKYNLVAEGLSYTLLTWWV